MAAPSGSRTSTSPAAANLSRLIGQLPALIYAQRGGEIFVNLFVESRATIGGVTVAQQTGYPWNGAVTVHVDPASPRSFTLAIRIPGWARGEASPGGLYRFARADGARGFSRASIAVNGRRVPLTLDKGFVRITRRWQKDDIVTLDLPMTVERVLADDRVAEDRGKAAIQRGPIVYCLEGVDNSGHVLDRTLPISTALTARFDPSLLGGVTVVSGGGVTAVPYYAWNNRGGGEMTVWIPE